MAMSGQEVSEMISKEIVLILGLYYERFNYFSKEILHVRRDSESEILNENLSLIEKAYYNVKRFQLCFRKACDRSLLIRLFRIIEIQRNEVCESEQ